MMNNLTESQKIILKRRLLIPSIVRHTDIHNTTLVNALKLADEYNQYIEDGDLDSALEHLPSVAQTLIRYAEETAIKKDEIKIKNSLELKAFKNLKNFTIFFFILKYLNSKLKMCPIFVCSIGDFRSSDDK